jgi:nucleotide-binding universal stress UspA family protein
VHTLALVFLNILVGVDSSEESRRALEYAVELAHAGNARLTLITVAPPVSSYVTLGGLAPQAMSDDLDRWAADVLAEAEAAVPDDVLVHRIQGRGHPGPEIVAELHRGGYDLVVLGSRGRGRAQEGLLGSVNAYVHFHARVPLLSVPPAEDGG